MSEVLQNLWAEQTESWEASFRQEKIAAGRSMTLRGVIMQTPEVEARFGIRYYNWMSTITVGTEDTYHIFQTPVSDRQAPRRRRSRPLTTQIPGINACPNLFEIPGNVGVVSERLLGAWAAHHAGTIYASREVDDHFWKAIRADSTPHIKGIARCMRLTIGNDLDMTKIRPGEDSLKRAAISLDASGLIRVRALEDSVTVFMPLAQPRIAQSALG